MNLKENYNTWASQYDTNENKTRDAEKQALMQIIPEQAFKHCLEIGCGTGKNTAFLATKATSVTAVDFSEEMLAIAKEKIKFNNVQFCKADITKNWDFALNQKFDLITFSLVLEHIENLNAIFSKVKEVSSENALVYVGEFHPFKQYSGSKARFTINETIIETECYTHHTSDFIEAAETVGFKLTYLNEFFDNNDRANIPRILGLLFEKIQPS
jgi:ubiquinone/menaquinone biosynthesis C-methylase UbiE